MDHTEVEVKALAYGGACVGDIVQGPQAGKKAFVRSTLPGERVKVKILSDKNSFVEADLLEIINSSQDRITPACPHFGTCGGCDLQHMHIKAQRQAKRDMVQSMLERQAKLFPSEGVQLIGEDLPDYGYRRRIMLHLDTSGKIGFFKSKSGEVVDIGSCPITKPIINAFFKTYRSLFQKVSNATASIVLESNGDEIFCGFHMREGKSVESILKALSSVTFPYVVWNMGKVVFEKQNNYPVGQFSQVNEAANDLLIEKVIESCAGEVITDFFAGSGNFSLPLAQKGKHVVAVEVSPELVSLGRSRALELGLNGRVTFHEESCQKFIKKHRPSEVVLLDPPRGGAKEVVTQLDPKLSPLVLYVSCNIPTLARDLVTLTQRGYTLKKTLVIDMFPQTHHVETLSLLIAT